MAGLKRKPFEHLPQPRLGHTDVDMDIVRLSIAMLCGIWRYLYWDCLRYGKSHHAIPCHATPPWHNIISHHAKTSHTTLYHITSHRTTSLHHITILYNNPATSINFLGQHHLSSVLLVPPHQREPTAQSSCESTSQLTWFNSCNLVITRCSQQVLSQAWSGPSKQPQSHCAPSSSHVA
jgi:hypothetical protein